MILLCLFGPWPDTKCPFSRFGSNQNWGESDVSKYFPVWSLPRGITICFRYKLCRDLLLNHRLFFTLSSYLLAVVMGIFCGTYYAEVCVSIPHVWSSKLWGWELISRRQRAKLGSWIHGYNSHCLSMGIRFLSRFQKCNPSFKWGKWRCPLCSTWEPTNPILQGAEPTPKGTSAPTESICPASSRMGP